MLNATNASSSFYNIIWSYYVEYLWDYEPNSVVGKIAYTFRVLAVLAILPLLVLALLDVSSYVIARTLGIVDDVKASTSDKQTVHAVRELPIIQIDSPKSPTFDNAIPPPKLEDVHNPYFDFGSSQSSLNAEERNADGSPQEYFTSEENNLKLSGFGVFSPATSQPPSPTITRRQMQTDDRIFSLHQDQQFNDDFQFRRRPATQGNK
ncbi:hypothetical protein Moror_6774 [Moniliophthora roreri MCA 2997]|uniref:Uncharacterized protein n=1 Tax=Moniliophthora roreri (strain MCA 2997) TaxID=1381753 RepID=V2YXW3_MONRO|nr:hypothetical protein Moror_6774 [Moniliophthora roreri MCA 2997]